VSIELPARYAALSSAQRRAARELYVERQGGACCYCKRPLNGPPPIDVLVLPIHWYLFPSGFMDHPIHLHHDHLTGMTIGAAHAYCNAVLFQYEGE